MKIKIQSLFTAMNSTTYKYPWSNFTELPCFVMISNQDCRELKADTRLSERESEPFCFSGTNYGNVISTLTDAKKNHFAD